MSFNIVRTDPMNTIGAKLGTVVGAVIYTADRRSPVLDAISLANSTAAAVVATVAWYDASAALAFTIFSGPVPLNGRVPIADIAIQMKDGDQIRASAASAPAVDMIITLSEPVGRNQ